MNNQTQNKAVSQQAQTEDKQKKGNAFSRFINWAEPYAGRIIWILAGIITAVLFLTIGFWATILIVILALIGYAIGVYKDNPMHFMQWLNVLKRFNR